MQAALYLIPVTLGETAIDRVLPEYNRQVIAGIRHYVVVSFATPTPILSSMN